MSKRRRAPSLTDGIGFEGRCSIQLSYGRQGQDSYRTERFWSKVEVSADQTACWPWAGLRDAKGYGRFCDIGAHRTAWTIANGRPVPAGQVVMHTCDNPSCCNPSHLKLGTLADNNADRDAKGRTARGEGARHAKLTATAVQAIRLRASEGAAKLAREFGVRRTAIQKILTGENWKHVPAVAS